MTAPPAYAPDFDVTINGTPIPASLRASITSVRYEDGVNAADRVEIGIANTDLRWLQQHIQGLGFAPTAIGIGSATVSSTPAGLFDITNSLALSIGYAPGPLDQVFVGDITGIEASFPSSGMPTMTIVAHDRLHHLADGKYSRGFGPLPDMVVAAIVSAENLLIPALDPTLVAASSAIAAVNFIFGGTGIKQKGQTDLQLLAEIAATYDADYWVDNNTLYVARFFQSYSPALTLTWGQSLLDFTPKVNTVGQITAAAMKFTLREIPLSFTVAITWNLDTQVVGVSVYPSIAAAELKSIIGPTYEIVDQPIRSPADLVNSALVILRELRTKLNARLTASGSAVGNTAIRAGSIIEFDGIGPDFSGNYRIRSATHTIDAGGYRTSFQVYKEIIP
jgi:phage protein D